MNIDELDKRLIDLLRRDGRATFADMGLRVGLSASAVKRRVDRLVSTGAIRGFSVVIDPEVDGRDTEAYVELFCRGTVAPGELTRILADIPDVVEAWTVTGTADGEWRADLKRGTTYLARNLAVAAADVSRAARELHKDLSTPIDAVIDEARSQQAAKVAALEAELEAARAALAGLDSDS